MNDNNSSSHTLDEIVFENRNKLYGAYVLRRAYNDHLFKAFLIAASVFLFLYFSSMIYQFCFPPKPIEVNEFVTPFKPMSNYEIVVEVSPTQEVPKVSLQQKTNSEIFEIAKDANVLPKVPESVTTQVPNNSGNATGAGETGVNTEKGTMAGGTSFVEPIEKEVMYADEMPEFPGGEAAMSEYLRSNITIPRQAEIAQVTGKVLISFIVETDGSITAINVEKSRGFGLDEEAVRVVQSMPKWKPGTQKNKKVRVKFFLPLRFDF